MLSKLMDYLPKTQKGSKTRDMALLVGGTGALVTGQRGPAIALFVEAMRGLEERWRAEHPEFSGGLRERWRLAAQAYDESHQDPTNRALHIVGIPMIAAGTAGLLLARPVSPITAPIWWGSLGVFTTGWALNFVGHGWFEKNAPAFADDPLSFVVGPVWDLKQIAKRFVFVRKGAPAARPA